MVINILEKCWKDYYSAFIKETEQTTEVIIFEDQSTLSYLHNACSLNIAYDDNWM